MKIHRHRPEQKNIPSSYNIPQQIKYAPAVTGDVCSAPSSVDCHIETGPAQLACVAWVG